jgi:uncharacterized membrane protein YjgN (DUF898 family)
MDQPARPLEWRFTGRATEYFRIWIIGVVLSLLTFGIYSAWAKVRSHQYFYRHTWLDGSSFEYIASPRELLRGRLLLALLLGVLFSMQVFFVPAAFITLLLLLAATPSSATCRCRSRLRCRRPIASSSAAMPSRS